jgi:hypothetical protein
MLKDHRQDTGRQAFQESEVQVTLKQVARFLSAHGSPDFDARPQTAAWTGQQVQIQAPLPAHSDAFWMLALITLPLALLLLKVKLRAGGALKSPLKEIR